MFNGWVLEGPHCQVEKVSSHFPFLADGVKAGVLNGGDALNMPQFVQIALENGASEQGSDAGCHFLST